MSKQQSKLLKKNRMYLISPHGISMKPMICNKEGVVKIHKLTEPPKKYDLVLYLRGKEQQGVIHRILLVKEDMYIIHGDTCWQKEYVKKEQVVGIVTKFYPKGNGTRQTIKCISCMYICGSTCFLYAVPCFISGIN